MRYAAMALIAAPAFALSVAARHAAAATPNENFVSHAYLDILSRPVDTPSLAAYANLLDTAALTPTGVAQSLLGSNEYRTLAIQTDFSLLLHRAALSGELSPNLTFLSSGGTDEQLLALLAGAPEYFTLHGSTNDTWLDGVYADFLNRALLSNERTGYDGALATNTRQQVAGFILGSQEYHTDLVDNFYLHFLHRPADLGVNGYITALGSGVTDETVIALMVGTPEYFQNAQTVPEPASLSLMTGAILLLLRRRSHASHQG